MTRVRLIKVIVSPVFVIDDGETLTEAIQNPITIPAAEWPTYSSERFPEEVAIWEATLNGNNQNGVYQENTEIVE